MVFLPFSQVLVLLSSGQTYYPIAKPTPLSKESCQKGRAPDHGVYPVPVFQTEPPLRWRSKAGCSSTVRYISKVASSCGSQSTRKHSKQELWAPGGRVGKQVENRLRKATWTHTTDSLWTWEVFFLGFCLFVCFCDTGDWSQIHTSSHLFLVSLFVVTNVRKPYLNSTVRTVPHISQFDFLPMLYYLSNKEIWMIILQFTFLHTKFLIS